MRAVKQSPEGTLDTCCAPLSLPSWPVGYFNRNVARPFSRYRRERDMRQGANPRSGYLLAALWGVGACSMLLLVVLIVLFGVQLGGRRVILHGRMPHADIVRLHRLWLATGYGVVSSDNASICTTVRDEKDGVAQQPSSFRAVVLCVGDRKLTLGLAQRECRTLDNAWECTSSGAPVFVIPFALIFVPVSVALFGSMLLYLLRRKAAGRRLAGQQCVKCGYCLFGLTSTRCPECGTPFNVNPDAPPQAPRS